MQSNVDVVSENGKKVRCFGMDRMRPLGIWVIFFTCVENLHAPICMEIDIHVGMTSRCFLLLWAKGFSIGVSTATAAKLF